MVIHRRSFHAPRKGNPTRREGRNADCGQDAAAAGQMVVSAAGHFRNSRPLPAFSGLFHMPQPLVSDPPSLSPGLGAVGCHNSVAPFVGPGCGFGEGSILAAISAEARGKGEPQVASMPATGNAGERSLALLATCQIDKFIKRQAQKLAFYARNARKPARWPRNASGGPWSRPGGMEAIGCGRRPGVRFI